MRDRRDGDARGVRASAQFIETLQDLGLKFCRNGRSTFLIFVKDSNEFRTFKLTVHTRVIAPEFACAHDGDTNLPRLSRRRAHSLFIPFEASFGSGTAGGGKSSNAIPPPSPTSITLVQSKTNLRPAAPPTTRAP